MAATGPRIPTPNVTDRLQVELRPGIRTSDKAIRDTIADNPEIRDGYCPNCEYMTTLFRGLIQEPVNRTMEKMIASGFSLAVQRSYLCTLCEIAVNPDARAFAIYRGYIWYLIGKPESDPQKNINRTLWHSAGQQLEGWREQSRTHLRATLAKTPVERGYDEASKVIDAEEKTLAESRLKEILGVHEFCSQEEFKRKALIGTIGIHEIMLRVERQEALAPAWLPLIRYFLTTSGMERIAANQPLGRDAFHTKA